MATYAFEVDEEIVACDECPFSAFHDMRMWCELMGCEVSTDDVDESMRYRDCPLVRLDDADDDRDLKCPLSDVDMQCLTATRERFKFIRSNKCANYWRRIASLYRQMPADMDAEDIVRALLVGEIGAIEAIRRIEEL